MSLRRDRLAWITCRLVCASRRRTEKRWCQAKRLEPAEAQFQFQFQLRFPVPVPGLVWSGLV